jgi:hypothetical protein
MWQHRDLVAAARVAPISRAAVRLGACCAALVLLVSVGGCTRPDQQVAVKKDPVNCVFNGPCTGQAHD